LDGEAAVYARLRDKKDLIGDANAPFAFIDVNIRTDVVGHGSDSDTMTVGH
jgi:hypothetical protein